MLDGVLALSTELPKGEPESVVAGFVESGKPTSCQLPQKTVDGTSLAVHCPEAILELPGILGNILALLCQNEPCRVATILSDPNSDEAKFQELSVWGFLSFLLDLYSSKKIHFSGA